jgi:hypothetical protein
MKVTFACCLTLLFCCFGMAVAAPQWTFDDASEIEGWGVGNQVEFTVENGSLRTVSLGGDPYFYPGGDSGARDWEPFSGQDFSTIFLRVKVNKTDTWQVYYITEEEAGWSENQRQNFEVEATGDFVSLEFVMERGGWQERTVTSFRIDPGVSEGVEAEIDYISLVGPPTAVKAKGKLATSWAKLKSEL